MAAGVVFRIGWTLAQWREAYRSGALQVRDAVAPFLVDATDNGARNDTAWISRPDAQQLNSQLADLEARLASVNGDLSRLPLYGVPFAVKDNIDAAGWNTTAACPAYSYLAQQDATVVRRLRAAGAIVVGKTNLDQFATGLAGTRSPYGAVSNAFRPEYISGGSSAGSASVVARGLVPFSLGTDTAGSGRVPASFNNIVGLKPTRGWLSTAGIVPACRTLDCVSVFALTVEDAEEIASIAGDVDAVDPYSRAAPADVYATLPSLRFAIPAQLEFCGDSQAQAAFASALDAMRSLGAELIPIDFAAFRELADLLYQGPWVAERFIAVEALLQRDPQALQPVLRGIVEGAAKFNAVDAFKAEYRRATLTRKIHDALVGFAALIVPTTPTIYTIAQIEADPLRLNSRLGTYTNFTNLADLSALALPAGMRADGLPAGITLIAMAWEDQALADFGKRWQRHMGLPLGATGVPYSAHPSSAIRYPLRASVRLAVVGAHLTGMPLNHQLTTRRAAFVERSRTAACYRLFALANTTPPKPGLVRSAAGTPIEVELWDVPLNQFGAFVAEIPAPLGIGTLELEDGRIVKGFICEPLGLEGARDISEFGGWRAYLASLRAAE